MTTPITDRERTLSAQIDEQGGQLEQWRDRSIAAEQASKWESDLCGQALEDRNASETKHAILVDEFEAVRKERDELREGIKRYEEMADMASAEIAVLTAELARLRSVEPVAYCNGDALLSFKCGNELPLKLSETRDGFYKTPLYRDAPPAQPAEPVQRLSDERAAFEAWHNEYRTQELVRRDDTYYNTHVRCRWEGWQARAIESALQPGWRDIESAPKDGRVVLLGKFNSHNKWRTMRGQWFSADAIAETWEDPDDAPEGWYETSVEAEDMPNVWYTEPTHWMPLPPAPKATK